MLLMAAASADTLISKASIDWHSLHIANAVDPATDDADFNATWYNPTTGGYTGGAYNGPAFTANQQAPFSYGGVNGLSGGTTLVTPASRQRYTSYFYKVVDGGNGYSDLKLALLADDGAFVYLNGKLIARRNVSAPDTFTTLASGEAGESDFNDVPLLDAPVLRPGPNLLAISIHQASNTSSDLGFDLELSGTPQQNKAATPAKKGPLLATTSSGGWAMLNRVIDGVGWDPAKVDADFNETWFNQSYDGYAGVAYDGPKFLADLTGPFAYGGVEGIPRPGLDMSMPQSGSRGTAYFLKKVDGGVAGHDQLILRVLADDGAYVYLNGKQVAVVGGLPAKAGSDVWDQTTSANGSETKAHEVVLGGKQVLRPGANLLAVSVHNQQLSSSDLGFSLELFAGAPKP